MFASSKVVLNHEAILCQSRTDTAKILAMALRNYVIALNSTCSVATTAIYMPLALNYIHVGSPNVTNLTFDEESRTLTCTSTGGPATTVTWRRDGAVITLNATYQQTKRIVDSVSGTYQTVLTINSSVGQSDIVETYNCTVENDRGGSSESVVVPGET